MKTAILLTAVVFALAAPASALPTEHDAKALTLEAERKGLPDLFADVAQQAGVGVIVRGADRLSATLSLADIPLGECMNLLAEMFSLLITWQGEALVVRPVTDAAQEAHGQLLQGRPEGMIALAALARGAAPMYGPDKLRNKLGQAVADLVQAETYSVLMSAEPDPLAATALAALDVHEPQVRAALAAAGLRGFLRRGQVAEALDVWDTLLQGHSAPHAIAAWGDLFLALHYGGFPQAFEFWRRTFTPLNVALLLQEGWREGSFGDALHFARLNMQYAAQSGRAAEAGAVHSAITRCLQAPRVIRVTCVVDIEATGDPRAEAKVRARVAKLSEVFEEHFGIRFEITEMLRWDPPSDSSFERQYAALKDALGSRRPELAVGFILEVFQMHPAQLRLPVAHLWTGYGCPHVGPYLLTRDFAFEHVTDLAASEWTFSSGTVAETLVHEMGHMFGALHVDDDNSVMRPSPTGTPRFAFDEVNARIIGRQKWKDFTRGVESLDEPELVGLLNDYRELARLSARPNGAPEEEARVHLALAKLYTARGEPARAVAHLREVVAIGAPTEIVLEARRLLSSPAAAHSVVGER